MNITPIYHGYYSTTYDGLINEALDSMIEEANPIKFSDFIQPGTPFMSETGNIIHLMAAAWEMQDKKSGII